jgi:hypothetical protein
MIRVFMLRVFMIRVFMLSVVTLECRCALVGCSLPLFRNLFLLWLPNVLFT